MAIFLPFIAVPIVSVSGYFSYKYTFNLTCNILDPDDNTNSIIGAMIGSSCTYILSGAVILHNSRKKPKQVIDRSEKRPLYTTKDFLKGSRRFLIKGSCIWCLSAITGALGSVYFRKYLTNH